VDLSRLRQLLPARVSRGASGATFAGTRTGHEEVVTEGLALAGGWLIYACMLSTLAFVLLRRPR